MAARPTDDLADEEVETAAAVEEPDEPFDLAEDEPNDELELDDDPDEALDPVIDEELDSDLDEDVDPVDPDEAEELTVPTFDEDEDDAELVRAVVEDEDEGELDADGLREGEFVCRSCYMAKRESALADPQRMLCRDCA